ncbi:cytochrome P450, partial [Panus rudis PR-1116 ss-1]
SLNRLVVRPFKFKDGIELPVGTQIFAPTTCIHGDNDLWVSADTFQPFRFCSASEQNPRGIPDTSPEFLTFGHGRHACPGRYLAACQLKIILAHLLTRFVIEFKAANKRPKDKWVGGFCFPETATILVFRRRA